MKNNKREQGFSLIELLIVVAIMLILAAIAIPAVANSVRAARESAAAQTLRTVNTAEQSYANTYKKFATNVTDMGDANGTCAAGTVGSTASCDLDKDFVTTLTKANYTFTRTATDNTFLWIAAPTSASPLNGRRIFCMVQGGTIHVTDVGNLTVPADQAACTALATL